MTSNGLRMKAWLGLAYLLAGATLTRGEDGADDDDGPGVDALEEIGGAGTEFLTCREEPGTWCAAAFAEARARGSDAAAGFQSADRLVRLALDIARDEACRTGVADAAAPTFLDDAVALFRRCHLVVVRNATSRAYMVDYKTRFDAYVAALRNGSIEGTTTHGERFFVKGIGDRRWLLLLPEAFGTPELLAPFWLRKLLSHPRLLGDNFKLNDLGAALAEPGGGAQPFHLDDEYLLGKHSLALNGLGGHDVPPTAITVLHALAPEAVTLAHGPTEFCVGSTALAGFDFPSAGANVGDPGLRAELRRVYNRDKDGGRPHCRPSAPGGPLEAMRRDELRLGDVVLFDYQIVHRGGPNDSPDLRALIYATYARHWYGDSNFKSPYFVDAADGAFVNGAGWAALSKHGKADFARIVKAARFAKPNEAWAAAATDRAAPGDSECAGEHRATAGAPLFAYDPAESYEADHFGSAQVDNGGEPLFVTKKITPEV
jgi:hypothetical protein